MTSGPAGPTGPADVRRAGLLDGRSVTTTDWLKVAGLCFVLLDHYGLFFDEDQDWWRVFGRLAAPIFFFLIGFARTHRIPWIWIVLGLALTAIDSWSDDWDPHAFQLNILLVFAGLRLALPWIEAHVIEHPARLGLLALVTIVLIKPLGAFMEYGMEGWLWAYFGLAQRLAAPGGMPDWTRWRGLVLGIAAGAIYAPREMTDMHFEPAEAVVLHMLVAGLVVALYVFRRRDAGWQPPEGLALPLRICGRYSLEIYAVTLAAMQITSELMD